jgi:hypothetical protein
MDTIKPVLTHYIDINKKLIELNARTKALRDQRTDVELDLAAAYGQASLPDKIELNASQMIFQVKKPGEWKKGWTLSKAQLKQYLLEILPESGEDVMKELVRRHEPTLTATDYSFELKPMTTS